MKFVDLSKKSKYGFGPFTIAFVYTPFEHLRIFGRCGDISDYVTQRYDRAIIGRHDKKYGLDWIIVGEDIHLSIQKPNDDPLNRYKNINRKFCFMTYRGQVLLTLRRIPRKWIPEYDTMIEAARRNK